MVITPSRRFQAAKRSAFTLLEILVVVAIVVTMASVSGVYVFRYLEDSKKSKAQLDCKTLETAVKTYMSKNDNNAPQGLNQVLQYIEGGAQDPDGKLNDPWGKPYQLAVVNDGESVEVFTHDKQNNKISSAKVQNH